MVNVAGDGPRMVAAVAEARRRWGEFAAAFRPTGDDEPPFMVKAEFRDGEAVEFMWVSVTKIEGDLIHGVLENSPHELTNVRQGQQVVVPLSLLNDWIFSNGDEVVGGFTMKVIGEMQQGG